MLQFMGSQRVEYGFVTVQQEPGFFEPTEVEWSLVICAV